MLAAGPGYEFHPGPEREQASRTVGFAHNLILFVLHNEVTYFGLPLAEELEDRRREFHSIWVEKANETPRQPPDANPGAPVGNTSRPDR